MNNRINSNPLIIFGSSRSNGDTLRAVRAVFDDSTSIPFIDLSRMNLSYYDYDHKNSDDDFLTIAENMIQHNPIILATPVYWYTMSAIMKTFIDRWSDLLDIQKDIGRKLRGKTIFVITSYLVSLPKGFEDAFSQTAEYMGMKYSGCYYFNAKTDDYEVDIQNANAANLFRKALLSLI